MAADVRMGCTFASKTKEMVLYDFGTDFIRLNERLVRKPFSLPTISTVLQGLRGYTYATALDWNQDGLLKPLDWILTPDASRICTINFPWGKYSYKCLPMDIAGPPDIFKEQILELMRTVEKSEDDLLTKTSSYQGKPQ